MNQRLKQEILDATRKAGCDWDGDTIIYNQQGLMAFL